MKRLNESGSHVVAGVVIVLVLGVVTYAGYKISQHTSDTSSSAQPAATTAKSATVINSKADLNSAANSLNTDSASLDNSLNGDSLDSDMNSLL